MEGGAEDFGDAINFNEGMDNHQDGNQDGEEDEEVSGINMPRTYDNTM